MNLIHSFTLNETTYATDTETLNLVRQLIKDDESECAIAVIELGLVTGRIERRMK